MTTLVSFRDFSEASLSEWIDSHKPAVVRPNECPATFGDRIKFVTPCPFDDPAPFESEVLAIPWILVEGMPCSQYPRYMGFLLRAAYAWLKATRPDLHRTMSNGRSCNTIVPVMGVRAGMIASLGRPCDAVMSPIGRFLHYDVKRDRLWIRKMTRDHEFSRWADALTTVPDVPAPTMEAMMAWCGMAPLLACMGSSQEFSMGSNYTVPFVQRSISSYLLGHMRTEAYAAMCLAAPLTWDSAMLASISGYPTAACRVWAVDPLMALCAERRAQSDPAAITHSRNREREVLRRYSRPASASSRAQDGAEVAAMWSQVRATTGYAAVQDEDAASMATDLMSDAPDDVLQPEDSVTPSRTAVPSRAPTPPARMTSAQVESVREAARLAQQMPNAAPSLIQGASGSEAVRW
jgi:hypothetical protein